jgi:hypothetical protein
LRRGEPHQGIVLVPVRSLSELVIRMRGHLDQCTPNAQRNNLLWA